VPLQLKSLARPLAVLLADLSPNCREAARLAALATRQPLSARRRLGLRLHVLLCRFCRRFERQLGRLRDRVASYAGEPAVGVRVRLTEESRERLRASLRVVPPS
jgi:hypothetical protein